MGIGLWAPSCQPGPQDRLGCSGVALTLLPLLRAPGLRKHSSPGPSPLGVQHVEVWSGQPGQAPGCSLQGWQGHVTWVDRCCLREHSSAFLERQQHSLLQNQDKSGATSSALWALTFPEDKLCCVGVHRAVSFPGNHVQSTTGCQE